MHPNDARGRVLLITHHRRSPDSQHPADHWFTQLGSRARAARLRELDSFSWVARLPQASGLSVALCLRNGLSCQSVGSLVRQQIAPASFHSCIEEPAGRGKGMEAVCAFRFIVQHYDASDWRSVYFAHDDVALNRGHRRPFAALRQSLAVHWPLWPETTNGPSEGGCGCDVVTERLVPGYMWHKEIKWCLREWIDGSLLGDTIRWPRSFMRSQRFAKKASQAYCDALAQHVALPLEPNSSLGQPQVPCRRRHCSSPVAPLLRAPAPRRAIWPATAASWQPLWAQ